MSPRDVTNELTEALDALRDLWPKAVVVRVNGHSATVGGYLVGLQADATWGYWDEPGVGGTLLDEFESAADAVGVAAGAALADAMEESLFEHVLDVRRFT